MTKIATEYLPSPGENFPSTPGQGSASTNSTNYANGAGDGKSIWRRTIAAYLQAAEDPRLSHGAVRLFVWLLERTFDLRQGGDGDGGLVKDVRTICERIACPANDRKTVKVPQWRKGKQVGWITRRREQQPSHPHHNSVEEWLNQLEAAGYIWREKIKCPGWPIKKIFISSIIPKTSQKELFTLPSERPLVSPSERPLVSPSERPLVSPSERQGMWPSERRSKYQVQDRTGLRGKEAEADQGSRVEEEGTNFEKWQDSIRRLPPIELRKRLEDFERGKKALFADQRNLKVSLRPNVAEFIAKAQAEIPELEASRKPKNLEAAARLRRKVEAAQKDPSNLVYSAVLKPGPAATLANLTRKIDAIKEALR